VFWPLLSPRAKRPRTLRSSGDLRSGHCRTCHQALYIPPSAAFVLRLDPGTLAGPRTFTQIVGTVSVETAGLVSISLAPPGKTESRAGDLCEEVAYPPVSGVASEVLELVHAVPTRLVPAPGLWRLYENGRSGIPSPAGLARSGTCSGRKRQKVAAARPDSLSRPGSLRSRCGESQPISRPRPRARRPAAG